MRHTFDVGVGVGQVSDKFVPVRVAQNILALFPDRAVEIVLAFIDDALLQEDRKRADLWYQVLAVIEARQSGAGAGERPAARRTK